MRYLPINLDVREKKVVVVGGGEVAARKCRWLLAGGALLTVVAPELGPILRGHADSGLLQHVARCYETGDLSGAFIAYAATDRPAVNRAVADEAHAAGILVEVCTDPDRGDFTSPAVVARGDFTLAVATGGLAPAMAGKVRRELEERYDRSYGETVRLLGAVREKLLTANEANAYNTRILKELASADLPLMFRNRDFAGIDSILAASCGPDYSLATLGLPEKDYP